MLTIQNIEKLIGTVLTTRFDNGWLVTNINSAPDFYSIYIEKSAFTICVNIHRLPNENGLHLTFVYVKTNRASNFESIDVSRKFETSSFKSKGQFIKELESIIAEVKIVYIRNKSSLNFNPNLQQNIYSTSSLVIPVGLGKMPPAPKSNPQITVQKNRYAPDWYVSEEELPELKKPTMWETFKEMVKWDKWIGILFPMKDAIEHVIPKKKKINAKKAAW